MGACKALSGLARGRGDKRAATRSDVSGLLGCRMAHDSREAHGSRVPYGPAHQGKPSTPTGQGRPGSHKTTYAPPHLHFQLGHVTQRMARGKARGIGKGASSTRRVCRGTHRVGRCSGCRAPAGQEQPAKQRGRDHGEPEADAGQGHTTSPPASGQALPRGLYLLGQIHIELIDLL